MRAEVAAVVSYRFRATLSQRWVGFVGLVVLLGLLGGLSMAAVSAGRRTQSAFPAFFRSTNPSDLQVATGLYDPQQGSTSGYVPSVVAGLARLPQVKRVESLAAVNLLPLTPAGDVPQGDGLSAGLFTASVDGEFLDTDRLTVTAGRLPNTNRPNEIVVSGSNPPAGLLAQLGLPGDSLRLGETLRFGVFTNAQATRPDFPSDSIRPMRVVSATIVGVGAREDAEVVRDDADTQGDSSTIVFTPALARQLLSCCVLNTYTGLQLKGGARDVPGVEKEMASLLPRVTVTAPLPATVINKAEEATKPESIALGAFGGIAGLATLVICAQAAGRQVRSGRRDAEVLRAVGASRWMTFADLVAGTVASVLLGAVLAAGVAIALSPIAPLGPVRPFLSSPGVSVDWLVVGTGTAILLIGLVGWSAWTALRQAPDRKGATPDTMRAGGSVLIRTAAAGGLPATALTGIHFALESRTVQTSVPVRAAILGAVTAVVVLVCTLTFGNSLNTLVGRPGLYGWNWNYQLTAGLGSNEIPLPAATRLLDTDKDLSAWSGYYFGSAVIDGQAVPGLAGEVNAAVAPPVLKGHGLQADDEVVLGRSTLEGLRQRIGGRVTVQIPGTPARTLRIVGTAALPALGPSSSFHLEIGSGAWLAYDLIPASQRNTFNAPIPGPNAIFVRLRPGVSQSGALRTLDGIAAATSNPSDFGVTVTGVQRPAEIVNYRSMGATPALLGVGLAAGAVASLGLTVVSAVRQRRRDLALLKALGFTGRQLGVVVAWQSIVPVLLGLIVGIPLGIAAGRWLWDVFARDIGVVPYPAVPAGTIVVVAAGAIVLALVVSVLPGRWAARTPTAKILRAE